MRGRVVGAFGRCLCVRVPMYKKETDTEADGCEERRVNKSEHRRCGVKLLG